MAMVESGQAGIDMSDFKFGVIRDDYPTVTHSDFFSVEWGFPFTYDFYGEGFKYDADGMPVAGTVTGFSMASTNGAFFTVGDISVSAKELTKVAWSQSHSDDVKLMKTIFSGADSITGGDYDDYEQGFGGRDVMRGYGGHDIIRGGNGNDFIDGGGGSDILRGDGGADMFIFADGYGQDTIKDFDATGAGHDKIDLSGLPTVSNFHDLMTNHIVVQGDDVLINGGKDVLTLHDVNRDDLSKTDFAF